MIPHLHWADFSTSDIVMIDLKNVGIIIKNIQFRDMIQIQKLKILTEKRFLHLIM